MSLAIATRAEVIKNKRGAAFWMCLIGAAFIPLILFMAYNLKPGLHYNMMAAEPWRIHFQKAWQSFSVFLLPMFVILTGSLIVQVEYKNNTWKQVFASPLSISDIFFSKYLGIIAMVVFLLIVFNAFLFLSGYVTAMIHPRYTFLERKVDWGFVLRINFRSFVSLLGILSIQYWLSLRFRNFIVPIGAGLVLLVASMVAMQWEHIDKIPYAFPFLSFGRMSAPEQKLLDTHELNSILYFIVFTAIAFFDLRFRKERG